MNFIKDRTNVCKTCTYGDRLRAKRVLLHNSFEIHYFMNHFFGFSILLQKNSMIQVIWCEHALLKAKANRKPIHNHQQGRWKRSGQAGHGWTRICHIPINLNSLLSRNNESYCLELNSRASF